MVCIKDVGIEGVMVSVVDRKFESDRVKPKTTFCIKFVFVASPLSENWLARNE